MEDFYTLIELLRQILRVEVKKEDPLSNDHYFVTPHYTCELKLDQEYGRPESEAGIRVIIKQNREYQPATLTLSNINKVDVDEEYMSVVLTAFDHDRQVFHILNLYQGRHYQFVANVEGRFGKKWAKRVRPLKSILQKWL